MGPPTWLFAAGVAGTWCVFVAAILGEKIRSMLFKPMLRVQILDTLGESITEIITNPQGSEPTTYERQARFYHVEAVNSRRWPIAHNVLILITRLERYGPDNLPLPVWTGEIPLTWNHPEIHPLTRTVGRAARAVLLTANDDPRTRQRELYLRPIIHPNNFEGRYTGETRLRVTLQATSDEVTSDERRLSIAWDGQWRDGTAEMGQHLIITSLK